MGKRVIVSTVGQELGWESVHSTYEHRIIRIPVGTDLLECGHRRGSNLYQVGWNPPRPRRCLGCMRDKPVGWRYWIGEEKGYTNWDETAKLCPECGAPG